MESLHSGGGGSGSVFLWMPMVNLECSSWVSCVFENWTIRLCWLAEHHTSTVSAAPALWLQVWTSTPSVLFCRAGGWTYPTRLAFRFTNWALSNSLLFLDEHDLIHQSEVSSYLRTQSTKIPNFAEYYRLTEWASTSTPQPMYYWDRWLALPTPTVNMVLKELAGTTKCFLSATCSYTLCVCYFTNLP